MEAAGHGGVPLAVELGSTEAGVAGWFCTYSHRLTGTDSSWIRRSRPNDGSGVVGLGSSWSPLSGCIDAFSHNQRWHPVPQITSACHQSILIHLLFMIAHIGSFFYNYWFLQSTPAPFRNSLCYVLSKQQKPAKHNMYLPAFMCINFSEYAVSVLAEFTG